MKALIGTFNLGPSRGLLRDFEIFAKVICPVLQCVVVQVGVMYCRAGQQTEEEMYNNEEGGPAFLEFLDLLGQRVRLKGFQKYKAGLCNKSKWRVVKSLDFSD